MPKVLYHIAAVLTVGVWGTTFIATKVLINHGLAPQEIFVVRFFIAYLLMFLLSHKKIGADSLKDECLFLLCGLTGGSLYFFTENTALSITQTTNVSFLICVTPLLTMLLSLLVFREEKFSGKLAAASLVAFSGVAILVFNGHFILKISPLGDLLTLSAAFSWAVYSLLIKKTADRYDSLFITRKVFFYGFLTILPVFAVTPWSFPASGFLELPIWSNLLFLSVVASMGCFWVWNIVVKQLGTTESSHYLYLNPLFTILFASWILDERLTFCSIVGMFMISAGVLAASGRKL